MINLYELLYKYPDKVRFTQDFGYTSFSHVYRFGYHTGVDFSVNTKRFGYPKDWGLIISPIDMEIVTDREHDRERSYGNFVQGRARDRQGNMITLGFGHLEENYVKVGDHVKKGQVIGLEGNTGFSTGSHLHFEIYKGKISPYNYWDRETFISRWLNPLDFENIFQLSEEEMKELEQLKQLNKELQQQLAKALYINDNRSEAEKYISSDTKLEVVNHVNKRGVLNEIYQILFSRDIDEEGYKYWKDKSMVDLIRGIRGSQEYKELGIDLIYYALLDRNADKEGLKYWSKEEDKRKIVDGIKGSEEYKQKNNDG